MKKQVAVLLAGCGHLDGAEINEAIMTLLALRLEGFEPKIFGIDQKAFDTVNHKTQQTESNSRNALQEAARIARGEILPLSELNTAQFSALALPGGFGVAKNFCSYATQGNAATVQPEVERVVGDFLKAGKPILAMCISPALIGLVGHKLGKKLHLTLGDKQYDPSKDMQKLGHTVEDCAASDIVLDEEAKLISTPAFMHEITLDQAWPGIQKAAVQLRKWS